MADELWADFQIPKFWEIKIWKKRTNCFTGNRKISFGV